MWLEFIYHKMLKLFVFCVFILSTKAVVVSPELFTSPCPDTFQYQTDQNGAIYGAIGIYSFNKNVVELGVQLSIGNGVNEYNGHIELAYPKNQVIENVLHQRPVKYKVFFPRWQNIPPRITKISVNGQVVCTGLPLPMGGWVEVLTTINLQHTLTIKMAPFQTSPFILNDSRKKTDNPFKSNFSPEKPDDLFIIKDGSSNIHVFVIYIVICSNIFGSMNPFIDCRSSTATEKINLKSTSYFIFSKNPFLNHNGSVSTVSSKNPPRKFKPNLSPSSTISSDICGKTIVPNPLIVNGNAVPRGAFPWLVAMFNVISTGLEYKCSGSLISKKHIVTAAHCIKHGYRRINSHKFLFVLGKLNIQRWTLSKGEKMIEAEDVKVHPDYKPGTSDADIAVAILSEEVQFSKYIRPICLWSESDDLQRIIGEKGRVVGWGKDENGAIITAEPKQTTMPIVTQEQCLWSSETFKYITSRRTFCAGDRKGTGPCNGDSGSGFIMMRYDRWVLRGIVSISTYDSNKNTCDLSNYVVFTDASKFKLWLASFI